MKEEILKLCADYFGCTVADIEGRRKNDPNVVKARKIAYYLLYQTTKNYAEAGRIINRSHTNIQRTVKQLTFFVNKGIYYSDTILQLKSKLQAA